MHDVGNHNTLRIYVTRKVTWLYEQKEKQGSPLATAQLAQLRRGAGDEPANHPELWEIIFGNNTDIPQFPKRYLGYNLCRCHVICFASTITVTTNACNKL